jgi:pyruvate dehydrogenase E2 component (dihydrolipoamide acetyltransferase)
MPRLSDSMEEGTILVWMKQVGDEVAIGEEIVEIETDKAGMAFEAPAAGALRIVALAEETVAVGEPIARIGDGAEEQAAAPPAAPADAGRPRISPVARRLAAERGIDLASVTGSGPGGRILKEDVLAVAPPPPSQSTVVTGARGAARREEPTRSQAIVARRMAEARATVPEFPVAIDVEIAAAAELRRQLKGMLHPAPTLNDLIVAAVARTLRSHPRLNAAYVDGGFDLYDEVNVGIAVAVEDDLVVPVIDGADRLSLAEIAARSRELVERTRSGEVTPPELAGGTCTISNLGMFGISWFQPIVNPPQAAILGVGGIASRGKGPPTLSLTLVSDHRIVYGAHAARFLADLRALLESPLSLVVSP